MRNKEQADPHEKTALELAQEYALQTIQNVSVFSNLTDEDKLEIMERIYQPGQDIITQGDDILTKADSWIYVIKEGKCEVFEAGVIVNSISHGDIIGERALLQNLSTRTATVRCIGAECKVICIGIRSLEKALGLEHELSLIEAQPSGIITLNREDLVSRLKGFPILQNLGESYLNELASQIKVQRHNPGAYILRKDDMGEEFYLLDRGRIGILQEEHIVDVDSVQLEGMSSLYCADEDETPIAESDNILRCAFKGKFTSSHSVLHSSGIGPAILSYAQSSSRALSHADTKSVPQAPDCPRPFAYHSPNKVKQKIKVTLSSGMFFGEGALLGDGKRGASVVSLTHTTLLVMSKRTFTRLMKVLECPPSPTKHSTASHLGGIQE